MDALIREFKRQYENVYYASIQGEEFIFRELTRKEYRDLVNEYGHDDFLMEEAVCIVGTLHPDDYDFHAEGKAGVPRQLAKQIIAASGYFSPEQGGNMLEAARQEMNTFEPQAEAYITQAFRTIRLEEMEHWTLAKLMRYLAKAEWVLTEIWGLPVHFKRVDDEQTDDTPQEPPTLQEMAEQIREKGGDPMIELAPLIRQKEEFLDFPLIGGTKLLENEELMDRVRKQIQRLSDG